MCDLIDLNSPDRKALLSSRLASPLIPAPTDTECGNYNTRSQMARKRDSLENNPFDMALHKTTEYIQKKDDPFEVTLEKAMKLKCKRNSSLRASPSEWTGNDVLKEKPLRDKLKLNKTLDESLFHTELHRNNADTNKISNDNIVDDTNNCNAQSNVAKSDNIIPVIIVQDFDLSILNQSVMNDTLFESDKESNNDQTKVPLENKMLENTEKDKMLIEQISVSTVALKVAKLKRSFSQGETITEKKSKHLNQSSSLEPLQIGFNNTSTVSSQNSIDILNKGFLKSFHSGSSVFSSLSNISSIPAFSSVSSTINSSLMQSNGTINRSFLESCSSGKSEYGKSSENIDLNREMKLLLPRTRKSMISVGNTSTRSSMSDLTERFNKLKLKSCDIQIPKSPNNNEDKLTCSPLNDVKGYVTVMENSDTCDVNNKLIDIDVFTLENNSSKEICRSSTSDTSSDSVFLDGSKVNKSIREEAKLLARTFEELALKTSSGSSMDDLISSNPLWTSELLPAFDDEDENLIELPVSPDEGRAKSKNVKVIDDNDSCMDKEEGLNNKVQDKVKELEMELVEPMSTGKRFSAVTLLLDLKKLIKADKNVEANELLENLEKALGINCQNNTELLATCLNAPNNLEKSPEKSADNVEVIKNVENSMEHSHENNLSNDSPKSVNFNDSCQHINNPKYVKNLNNESKCQTIETINKSDEMKNKKEEKLNTKNLCTESPTYNDESNNLLNGRVVIELLTNIGQLLSKQTEENPTLDILKNLGNILNFASNNAKIDKDTNSNSTNIEIQQTPKNSKLKCENKKHPTILSKSVNRISLHSESKKQPSKNLIRRTISASQTLPHKNESISLISANKSISQLREVTKRFPGDPSFVSPAVNKKIIITNYQNALHKDVQAKPSETLELSQEKSSRINPVKNKLKKKLGAELLNKKGPMKAILPIGSMQKRESFNKKIPTTIDTVTPPKSNKLISSTPNSTNGEPVLKKSRSSKPVASSTPDAQHSKPQKMQSQLITSPKKRNFSCDISPVTIHINVNNNGPPKSPRRNSKLPSPKKMTPKRQSSESSIPRSQTPPISKRLNSSFDLNRQYERTYQSPQHSSYKTSNMQKYSPVALKTNESMQRSPLRDNNKFTHKVRPTNLISKLRRHSIGSNMMEKENGHI